MSESKLRKFIARPRTSPVGDRKLQPIVLTDSKGNWLKRQISDETENQIIWQAKSGARVEESTRWLKNNIANKIIRHGDIWLYVWLGTCNLTRKNKNYIDLAHPDNSTINEISQKYKEIADIVSKYPGSKVTFLETPVYSIKKWNQSRGHKDPETFEEQDKSLQEQIYNLNKEIRTLNNTLGTHSPQFSSDLHINRKVKSKTINYYNFNLYADGIHPDTLLSKAWLRKIAEQVKRDCWTIE
jgi:hypothetical protein